jgi:hypothetical protein
MLDTKENTNTEYYFLSYKPEGKQTRFDYSKIQMNGKSICQYKPKNYLNGQDQLFNPFVSFRIMLQFILLDKKGRIKFLDEAELFQVLIYLTNVDYEVGTFGAYLYLTINKKTDKHE